MGVHLRSGVWKQGAGQGVLLFWLMGGAEIEIEWWAGPESLEKWDLPPSYTAPAIMATQAPIAL